VRECLLVLVRSKTYQNKPEFCHGLVSQEFSVVSVIGLLVTKTTDIGEKLRPPDVVVTARDASFAPL
jgi:hypothetical protein